MKTTMLQLQLGVAGQWGGAIPAGGAARGAVRKPSRPTAKPAPAGWLTEALRQESPGLGERLFGWILAGAAVGALGWLAIMGWQASASLQGLSVWVRNAMG